MDEVMRMLARMRCCLVLMVLGIGGSVIGQAQESPAPVSPAASVPAPPPADAVAAKVNGQTIPELAVFRALSRQNPKDYDLARKDVLNYLVDNVLIDQYLVQLKLAIETKEVDEKIEQIKTEAKKSGSDFEKILKTLFLTEEELRKEMVCALRWDKFVQQQANDKALKDMFAKHPNLFDGSQVQARHILVKAEGGKTEAAATKIADLKKQIEAEVAQELAKLPAESNTEKEKAKILEKVFARVAGKESACPSKENGGDLGSFPRTGAMVEPFARAAFALKPFQLSDPVTTEFGCHLILATDLKPGKEVKFDDVKPFVREIYSDRLREAVIAAMRPQSKIVLQSQTK